MLPFSSDHVSLARYFASNENGARIPIVSFARQVIAAFQKQDPLAGRSQVVGESSSARSGANDDHVKMSRLRHCFLR